MTTQQEQHGRMIALGPGCYFLLMIWTQILNSQPVDVGQLADATAISAPTVRKYLAKLRAFGYILPAAGDRWQLAGNQAQLDFLATDGESGTVVPVIDAQVEDIPGEPGEKKFFFPLKEEEEEVKLINDSSSKEERKKFFFLEKSEILFQGAVVTHGLNLEMIPQEDILGWLAEAYDTRKRLANPAGLVYRRLEKGIPARNKYRNRPGDYLPAEYLEAVGLVNLIPVCDRCGFHPCQCPPPPDPDPDPEELENYDQEPAERVNTRWKHYSPAQAWETVVDQLQMEMPKAAFDTWVRDAVLIDADPEKLEFLVGVGNSYARDWLADRLTSQVTRLLIGIMNQSGIDVRFEVVK